MKKENNERFVVSWSPLNKQCIYGKDHGRGMVQKHMQPLTLKEAERKSKELWGGKVGIYKLVLIKEIKGKS